VKKTRKVLKKKTKRFDGIVLEVDEVTPTVNGAGKPSGNSQVTISLYDRKSGGLGYFRTSPHYVYGLCQEELKAANLLQGNVYKLIPLRRRK